MTDEEDIIEEFWNELGRRNEQRYYTKPDGPDRTGHFVMAVDDEYIIDVVFWEIFETYPLAVVAVGETMGTVKLTFRVDMSGDGKTLTEYLDGGDV